MRSDLLHLRDEIVAADIASIGEIVTKTSVFSREEIEVAVELAVDRLTRGQASDDHFLRADRDNKLAGYTCFGRIPLTAGRYDLYWIVVDLALQQQGIASALMKRTENAVLALGGKALYAETSSREIYAPAQAFYLSHAFAELARLPNFYADGDDKLIFGKTL